MKTQTRKKGVAMNYNVNPRTRRGLFSASLLSVSSLALMAAPAFAQDTAPRTAIEIARASLPAHLRPNIAELDQSMRVTHLQTRPRAA